MSSPAPGSAEEPAAAAAPKAKLRRAQVVSFRFTDPVLGVQAEDVGVVLSPGGDGEAVVIRPLARYDVHVPADDVSPVSADDVSQG